MLSIEECRKLLGRNDMTDDEVAEFLKELRHFLGRFLDDYFRDAFDPEEV